MVNQGKRVSALKRTLNRLYASLEEMAGINYVTVGAQGLIKQIDFKLLCLPSVGKGSSLIDTINKSLQKKTFYSQQGKQSDKGIIHVLGIFYALFKSNIRQKGISENEAAGALDNMGCKSFFASKSSYSQEDQMRDLEKSLKNQAIKNVYLSNAKGWTPRSKQGGYMISQKALDNRNPQIKSVFAEASALKVKYKGGTKTPPQTQSVGEEDCEENLAVVYNTGYTINNHPGGNDDYIGCFRSYSTTPLGGFHKKFETQLTPEKCTELCFKKGYLYSGTKNNNECHCGDNRLSENKVGDDGCSSPCSGDTKKRCGGIGKLSLYSTGITDVSATGKLIGCFIDETLPRVLDQYKTDLDNTNSPRRCLNYCLALGYLFAGVEYQRECFCGNTRPSSSLNSPDSECNSICSGDSSEICGGNWRIAVYRTGNGDSVSPPDKVSPCEPSVTLMNGKPACRGATLFIDTFSNSTLHPHWKHEIKIADTPVSK
ncbi:hypothetical protein J6590_045007 [Homalodisca vitripennis]|nr:hypothetical protein J6590_045007 [Homalodisca vitripennis]